MDKRAFTLIEIIIVVAILSLLLAVAVPNMIKARGTAIEDTCRANRGEVAKTIATWAVKMDLSVEEMQNYYGSASPGSKIATGARDKGVVEDSYLDASNVYCPAHPGDASYEYSSWILDSGRVVVDCPEDGH